MPVTRRTDERGIALPMALFTLLALTSLSLAFVALPRTEPAIAVNHLRAFQARAIAESGIERAVWALTNATAPGGIGGSGITVTTSPGPPYDGSIALAVGASGRFRLMVIGGDPNTRTVRSLGWSPAGAPGAGTQVVATVARVPNLASTAPCVLCTTSSLDLHGAVVDARGSETSSCGAKVAGWSGGSVTVDGASTLFGAGAAEPGAGGVEGRDWVANQMRRDFLFSPADLDVLKALAETRGSYVRPPSSTPLELTGVADGLVFVDTPDGTNTLTATNLATVIIARGFSARTPFKGWIVVNGDVAFAPGFGGIEGVVYATNTLTSTETGDSRITGMVVVAQGLGAASVSVDSMRIGFDCAAARGAGQLPEGWFVKPGSYCDASNGC